MTDAEKRQLLAALHTALHPDMPVMPGDGWPWYVNTNNKDARGIGIGTDVPDYLSWNGFGALLEAMSAKGWRLADAHQIAPGYFLAQFEHDDGRIVEGYGATLPEAAAKAALAALEGQPS